MLLVGYGPQNKPSSVTFWFSSLTELVCCRIQLVSKLTCREEGSGPWSKAESILTWQFQLRLQLFCLIQALQKVILGAQAQRCRAAYVHGGQDVLYVRLTGSAFSLFCVCLSLFLYISKQIFGKIKVDALLRHFFYLQLIALHFLNLLACFKGQMTSFIQEWK